MNSERPPPLEPWRPPDPTLAQGIFFYHKTHHAELTQENVSDKTQNAIKKAFVGACITPFKPGAWKPYVWSYIRKQALSWGKWLSIPTLVVRLSVTVPQDTLKVYRVREVIFRFFGRFPLLSLNWDGFVASMTVSGWVAFVAMVSYV